MLLASSNALAEPDGAFPKDRIPAPKGTNPFDTNVAGHSVSKGVNAGQAAVPTKDSYALPQDRPSGDTCTSCGLIHKGIMDNTGITSDGTVVDTNGNPVDISK